MKRTYYALEVGSMKFMCMAPTPYSLEDNIKKAYWNWRATQSARDPEENKRIEIFLQNKIRVKVMVEYLE